MVVVNIPHNFTSRDYQKPLFKAFRDGYKRAILVWHRRAGKEKTCFNLMICNALKKVGVYFYIFPTYSQGRKILWDGIDKSGFRFLKHIPDAIIEGQANSSDMKIRLKNGSLIQVLGADNVDSLVGTNPMGVVFSEYSLQDPTAWQLIRPILAENGGWAIFNFTPRGANHAKELLDMARGNDKWFTSVLTIEDTGAISIADIEEERKAGMSEDFIQQEFYCSFTLGVEGSYYAKYMQNLRDTGRIGRVAYDQNKLVNTVWDIGYGDSTSIIFYQVAGNDIHIIDYYEQSGEGLPHYATVLRDKGYLYDSHYAPHDMANGNFTTGLSGVATAAALGIRFIILPTLKISIEEGIEAGRSLFPRLWIDSDKAARLIKCLENYRKQYDEINGIYKSRPLHNWASHGCFPAGTLISTKSGQIPIEQLKKGDLVLTPTGYRSIKKLFEYKADSLLTLTQKNSLTCTPNHKIFTQRGLIQADALRYSDTIYTLEDTWKLDSTTQTLGFREAFSLANAKISSYSTATDTAGTEDITDVEQPSLTPTAPYTEQSGHLQMELYPTNTTSITSMETPETTALKILNALTLANTRASTDLSQLNERNPESASTKQWSLQNNGTLVKRALNGTSRTQRRRGLERTQSRKLVVIADLAILLRSTTRNFVQTLVKQELDISTEATTNQEHVVFAQGSLKLTNMPSKKPALQIAQYKLPTKQSVYDIEVEHDHCYYANGFLVSNSDSYRYLAIAIKRSVDSAKAGMTDAEVERLMNKYQPVFDR